MQFKKVTHVLFDLDGLLLDSEVLYTQMFATVCARYGKEFTWEVKSTILGFQGQECASKIIKFYDIPVTIEDFMKQYVEVCEVLMPNVQLMPGAQKLVEHLHKKGVPIALATSSSEQSVKIKMQNHMQFLELFHHLTMGTSDPEVTRGKPDPCIFLVCASRFPDKPKTGNCLVFEDAINGLKAGLAANMQVVLIPDPRIDKAEGSGATLILNSLEEFKPEVFGLPPYDD